MRPQLSATLRFRLLSLLVLSVIPALALVLYTASGDRAAAAADARGDALNLTRRAVRDQAAIIEQGRLTLVELAQVYKSNIADARICNAIYADLEARFVRGYPRYANLGVTDLDGRIFCSVAQVSGPVDLSALPEFQAARAGPDFVVGEPVINEALGTALINLYYPVLDFNGQPRIVLLATLDLGWLQAIVAEADLPAGSALSVIDSAGHVVAHYAHTLSRPADPQASQPTEALLRAMHERGSEGTVELPDAAGVQRLYAFSPLYTSPAGRGLYAAVGVPSETVFAQADQVLLSNLLALGLAAGIALTVSWVGSGWLVIQPVHDLLAATRRLAAGDLSARTGPRLARVEGEVGELAKAFDQMAASLQERDEERRAAEGALRRSEALYRNLARHFPGGAVFLFDHDLRYVVADGAGLADVGLTREMLEGKTVAEVLDPATQALIDPLYRGALAGREASAELDYGGRIFQTHALPLRNELGEIFAGMVVTSDITERRKAFQLLEQRVAERTRELHTLLGVSREVSVTLELEPLLERILDSLRGVVAYDAASIVSLEGEMFHTRAYRGPAEAEMITRFRFPANLPLDVRVMETRQPLCIDDIRGHSPDARMFRAYLDINLDDHYPNMHSWLRVPLIAKDRVIGMLTLHHSQPGFFGSAQADLALAFANQAAIAIENARMFSAERRRAEQFRLISQVGQRITSILSVNELLQHTVRLIRESFGYYHVHVGLIDGDVVVFSPAAGVWRDDPDCRRCSALRLKIGQEGVSGWAAATGEPLIIPDVRRDPRYVLIDPYQAGSAVVLPLQTKGRVIGVLNVESEQLNAFDASDIAVMQALVSQLAIALENAQLYEQAGQLAALEERQKLARELHDSVSQALFGIALGARTARTLLERDPARATDPLDYVLSLAEAGLAEMRALIFELRPESIKNEGLVAALTKQTDSLRARHRLDVQVRLASEPALPLDAKEALYRISQEALHNIAKHARASRVDVRLEVEAGQACLEIADDGQGFDPRGHFPGHLGLHSMRERADRANARFDLESAPGAGTRIRVSVPLAAEGGPGPSN